MAKWETVRVNVLIGKNDVGTYGIIYNAPPYRYSGPYLTREGAEANAIGAADFYGYDLQVEHVDTLPDGTDRPDTSSAS